MVPENHDVVGDMQPQPGTFTDGFGGEERFEDALLNLDWDTWPIVSNFNHDLVAIRVGSHFELAVPLHGVEALSMRLVHTC